MARSPIPAHFALATCSYPEQDARERWETDARRMRELGLTYVRLGEFGWSRLEPAPARFAWGWLDEAIAVYADAGLRVILGTPTAAPPVWLVRRHHEVLPWDAEGQPRRFGARRHCDVASPVYRDYAGRVTRAMAERYGHHPAVDGWQIDNEFGDHETGRSYGPASQAAFRVWLQERYGSLAALNDAWGAVFWSQEYTAWDQIDPPNLTVTEPNPSHVLDYRRFASDAIVSFLEEQVAIVREHSPGRWITHNFMRLCPEFDHFRAAACLDLVSWDVYPTGAVEFSSMSEAERVFWARTGEPDLMAFNHDLHRGLKAGRDFWVMEHQAGQINWAPSNALPADGAVSLWTVQAWVHGASCVSYFRWRAATVAQELMHSGLLRHDGSPDRGAAELDRLPIFGLPNGAIRPAVVLLHDYDALWSRDCQPHAAGAGYWEQIMLFYRALRSLGVDVDLRHPEADLSGYRLIVAPSLDVVGEARAVHLTRHVGHAKLVVGPRAGFRTPTGRVHESGQPGPLRELLGCGLLNVDGLRPGLFVHASGHRVEHWAENYRLLGGEAVATYDDGPLAGTPAVVRHGPATTIGAWSPPLVRQVLAGVLHEIGEATLNLPDGLRVSRRGGYEVWVNFTRAAMSTPNGQVVDPVSFVVTAIA